MLHELRCSCGDSRPRLSARRSPAVGFDVDGPQAIENAIRKIGWRLILGGAALLRCDKRSIKVEERRFRAAQVSRIERVLKITKLPDYRITQSS